MRRVICCSTLLGATLFASQNGLEGHEAKKKPDCFHPLQTLAFNLFRAHAMREGERVPEDSDIRLSYTTEDGTALVGWERPCVVPVGRSACLGAILFVQGEGDLVSQDIDDARPFSKAGWDVFMYDFRGYGNSGGYPSAISLESDYHELALHLKSTHPGHFVAYGGSLGGVILANSLDSVPYDELILDSVPSRLPRKYFCSTQLDPIEHVPSNAKRILLISGTKDSQTSPKDMRALMDKGRKSGATVWDSFPWPHIFQSDSVDIERFTAVAPFLNRTVEGGS